MPYYMDHPFQEEVLRITADKLKERMYVKLADFEITGYITKESVPFERRHEAERRTFVPGESWGELWDCGWFDLRGTIPPEAVGQQVVARLDFSGEGCIFSDAGVPLKGITSVKSRMTYTLGMFGKTIYELTPCAKGGEKIDLILEAGNNDLFGNDLGGRIEIAEIALCRKEIRKLYYDFAVLYELMKSTPPEEPGTIASRQH